VTVPGEAQASYGGISGYNVNGRSSPDGVFKPYELPVLAAEPYGPHGEAGTNADCQGGQNGYPLGRLPVENQAPGNPAIVKSDLPGSRGPTTTFWDDNGRRVLFDSRVPSRQPGSWNFGGGQ